MRLGVTISYVRRCKQPELVRIQARLEWARALPIPCNCTDLSVVYPEFDTPKTAVKLFHFKHGYATYSHIRAEGSLGISLEMSGNYTVNNCRKKLMLVMACKSQFCNAHTTFRSMQSRVWWWQAGGMQEEKQKVHQTNDSPQFQKQSTLPALMTNGYRLGFNPSTMSIHQYTSGPFTAHPLNKLGNGKCISRVRRILPDAVPHAITYPEWQRWMNARISTSVVSVFLQSSPTTTVKRFETNWPAECFRAVTEARILDTPLFTCYSIPSVHCTLFSSIKELLLPFKGGAQDANKFSGYTEQRSWVGNWDGCNDIAHVLYEPCCATLITKRGSSLSARFCITCSAIMHS